MNWLFVAVVALVGGYVYWLIGEATLGYEEGRLDRSLPGWRPLVAVFLWPLWWLARGIGVIRGLLDRGLTGAYSRAYQLGNARRERETDIIVDAERQTTLGRWMGEAEPIEKK